MDPSTITTIAVGANAAAEKLGLWDKFKNKFLKRTEREILAAKKLELELKAYERILDAGVSADVKKIESGEMKAEASKYFKQVDAYINPERKPTDYENTDSAIANFAISGFIDEQVKKLRNTERAFEFAQENFTKNESPPDIELDEEWSDEWKDGSGRASNEFMQRMWGALLAGQIKKPGSISRRALIFMRSLSQQEAMLISRVFNFIFSDRIFSDLLSSINKSGISFDDLMELQNLGVLTGVGGNIAANISPGNVGIGSKNKLITFNNPDVFKLPCYALTKIGSELYSISNVDNAEEFIIDFINYLKSKAKVNDIKLLTYVHADKGGKYANPVQI
jgi:hypothetical protein